MKLPVPGPGLVIRYNFLWRGDAEAGREDGTKVRPCAIVAAVHRDAGRTVVTVVPVTHSPPGNAGDAVELSGEVKRVLGLDAEPSWIVTRELNSFIWPGADPETIRGASGATSYGRLPRPLLARILRAVLDQARNGRAKAVKRSE